MHACHQRRQLWSHRNPISAIAHPEQTDQVLPKS
jgi:hypothetical protein